MKEEIKEKIKQLADTKYKEFHSGLCPGTNNILGVRVPVLRKLAKEIYNTYNWEEYLSYNDLEFYEEILLQGMIIGFVKADIKQVESYINAFVPKINNWAVCDIFCAGLKITKKHQEEMWSFIQNYLKSEKEFELRFSIVMMLDYFITDNYINKVLIELDKIKNDAYYVKMAIAWAISICYIKFPEKTFEYLKNNTLDDWTYNKAIQKIIESYRVDEDTKELLRKMKK